MGDAGAVEAMLESPRQLMSYIRLLLVVGHLQGGCQAPRHGVIEVHRRGQQFIEDAQSLLTPPFSAEVEAKVKEEYRPFE